MNHRGRLGDTPDEHVIDRLLRATPDGILLCNGDGLILRTNAQLARIFGYEAAELVGQDMSMLLPERLRAGHSAHVAGYRAAPESRPMGSGRTITGRRRDGSEIHLDISLEHSTTDDGALVIAIVRDLTEQDGATATLRSLMDELREARRMGAIGELAGSMAHDFNNLLSIVSLYAAQLQQELRPEDPVRQEVDEIHRAAERARVLTHQLLGIARPPSRPPEMVEVSGFIEEIAAPLRLLASPDIEIVLPPPTGPLWVKVERSALDRVLMNLVLNARDAMPEGGRVTIELRNVQLDAVRASPHTSAAPGLYTILRIRDTGSGMAESTRARIFAPFFTTKAPGKGAGFGLPSVLAVLRQSGGHIEVESEPGKGTCFDVYLPRAVGLARASERPAATSTALSNPRPAALELRLPEPCCPCCAAASDDHQHARRA